MIEPGTSENNTANGGPDQQTQSPQEIIEELFGQQHEVAHEDAEGAAAEDILGKEPVPAAPGPNPASSNGGPAESRHGSRQRPARSSLQKTVFWALGKAAKTIRGKQAPSISPPMTNPQPHDHQQLEEGGESLAQLERRIKISLRECSLASVSKIGVGGLKGGVGKSSTAYGVAGAIAYYTNMRVVCVDAEPNFGSLRLVMPNPIDASVVELARDADDIEGLSQLKNYIAQNEKMRLDAVLGPARNYELTHFDDLGEAYARIDRILSRHYDIIVYDLGIGFSHPAIRRVLSLCNELLFVSDSEVIPNAMLDDGVEYLQHLDIDLGKTTLVINHRLPQEHESADNSKIKEAAEKVFRRVTDIKYDHTMSQLINRRAFHVESLRQRTRCGILATAMAALEGLMISADAGVTGSGKPARLTHGDSHSHDPAAGR